ncbi:MAG: hypothetical protein WBJ54_02510 [Syntrophorhabdus sp.]|jgi:hypothetical protein
MMKLPKRMNRPQKTHNPGNLRYAKQTEAIGKDEWGMAIFPNDPAGWRALHAQIALDQSRGMTVRQFVAKYAPEVENNTSAYLQFVTKHMKCEPDEPLENLSRFALAGVIAVYEGYCAK